jgi:signal recognition particle subunit SRP54
MLEKLKSGLRNALETVTRKTLVDKETVEQFLHEVQRTLLMSDVNVDQVDAFSESIRRRAFEKLPTAVSRKEHLVKVIYEELTNIMGRGKTISLKPKRILLVGLFGSGKTTLAGKLARYYQKKGLKPLLIACDTVRPAAHEQLEQIAKKVDVLFYGNKGSKSDKILKKGLQQKADIYIIDSSGRDALDKELAKEIQKLAKIAKPDETILVIPADIGQAAKQQAAEFRKMLNITDVAVTKMDATAKAGGALTACAETGATITFLSTGETPDDLELFEPEKFVSRLLGMPDLESLLQKVQNIELETDPEKLLEGEMNLKDFCEQVGAMKQMGPLSGIMESIGISSKKIPEAMLDAQQEKMDKWKHIINSCTPEEISNPEIIKHQRIARIATGAGVQQSDVRELLSNYRKIQKMMKKLKPGKLKRSGLGGLLKQFGINHQL